MEQEREDEVVEAAMNEALEQEPRASELYSMAQVLLRRFHGLKDDLNQESDPAKREKIKKDLIKLREQIQVLTEEAGITQFVEETVRVGIEMRRYED
jgi:hypothetical protein